MSGVPVRRSGRGWAYTGVVLGAAVSVAANVAHSYVPPGSAPAGWSPEPGAVISAVFWPVLLLVAVEMFARIAWPVGRAWLLLRWGGLLPVAVIAAVVSYRHLSGLLIFYGEDGLTATIGPLAVDGLMLMAAGALIAGRGAGRVPVRPVMPEGATAPEQDSDPPRSASTGQVPEVGAGTGRVVRTDAELTAALGSVRRDVDGTVPIRRAARALGVGPGRARRLLADAGLLRTGGSTDPVPDTQGSDVR